MGGRGASGSAKVPNSGMQNTSSSDARKIAVSKVKDYITELQDRQYYSGKSFAPKKFQDIYRTTKNEIVRRIKDNGNYDPIVFSGGFLGDENFIHTTRALNSFQAMVRSDARKLKSDIELGVINKGSEVNLKLAVLKSLDLMIQDRRKVLKEFR